MFSLQTTSPTRDDSRLIWGYYITASILSAILTLGVIFGPMYYLIAGITTTFHPFFASPGLTNAIIEIVGTGLALTILWVGIPYATVIAHGSIEGLFFAETNKDRDKHLGTTNVGLTILLVAGVILSVAQLSIIRDVSVLADLAQYQLPHTTPIYWATLIVPSLGSLAYAYVVTDIEVTDFEESDSSSTNTTSTSETTSQKANDRQKTGANQDNEESQDNKNEFQWAVPNGPGFDQIGGYEDVKTQFRTEVIDAIKDDDGAYERFGVTPPTGILLHGPPGTGKSLFGEALADELGVPYTKLTQADLSSKWVNETPELVNTLFTEAEQFDRALVFIDEIDGLLSNRGGQGHSEDSKTVNEFLPHLADNDDVIVVAATNRRDILDDAAIRSGRFDLDIEVGLPDQDARRKILDVHLEGRENDISDAERDQLAKVMEGMSGADIESLVERSARKAAHENHNTLKRDHIWNEV